jgi:hypothetical protein
MGWLRRSRYLGSVCEVRFNRRRNGYRLPCKPPGCRQLRSPNGFPAPACTPCSNRGASVPTGRSRSFLADPGWSRRGCRPVLLLPETAEGMPWAPLVLSWLLHQMPRPGERCSFALHPIGFRAFGRVRSRISPAYRGSIQSARPWSPIQVRQAQTDPNRGQGGLPAAVVADEGGSKLASRRLARA